MVVMEPSWPVFMACSMSKASSPRTSPMMMRSGRMRRLLISSCRWRTPPWPSTLGGRVSSRTTSSCCSCSSAASSMVTSRSLSGMKLERIFRKVVLPAPVPPEIRMLMRALTAAARISSMSGEMLFSFTSVSAATGPLPKRRMDRQGPSSASGGIMALTREPSGSRASTMGDDSSTRRPTRETIRSITCIRCRSSRNTTLVFSSSPCRSAYTRLARFTRMSEMEGSFSSGSSGPSPNTSSSRSDSIRPFSWAVSGTLRLASVSWTTAATACRARVPSTKDSFSRSSLESTDLVHVGFELFKIERVHPGSLWLLLARLLLYSRSLE